MFSDTTVTNWRDYGLISGLSDGLMQTAIVGSALPATF